MTEDATLTDFLEGDGPGDEGDAERGSGHGTDPDSSPVDDGSTATDPDPETESATPTAAWGRYVCRDCGSNARRVWRDGEEYVCPECKSW